MAAGDVTMGRRVRDLEPHEYEPGDYGLWRGAWFCRAPGGDGPRRFMGNLSAHAVVEHEDGTITVHPSILVSARWAGEEFSFSWHGYLKRGVWREV